MTERAHTHVWTSYELVKVTRIDNKLYKGTAGDKAFIVRVCACSATEPADYGRLGEMKASLERLNKVEELEEHESNTNVRTKATKKT